MANDPNDPNNQERKALIASLEEAVKEGLDYFRGPGATSQVKIDQWGPREVLSHCLFWHESTARGIESVTAGGRPEVNDLHVDEANARAVSGRAGQGIPELVGEAERLEQRLVRAFQALEDIDATVLVRADGTRLSGRQRLETIAHHWREHVVELEAVPGI